MKYSILQLVLHIEMMNKNLSEAVIELWAMCRYYGQVIAAFAELCTRMRGGQWNEFKRIVAIFIPCG